MRSLFAIVVFVITFIACSFQQESKFEPITIHWKYLPQNQHSYLDTRYSFEECFYIFYIGPKYKVLTLDNFAPLTPIEYYRHVNPYSIESLPFILHRFSAQPLKTGKNDIKVTIKHNEEIPVIVYPKKKDSYFARYADTLLFTPIIIENISNHFTEIIYQDQVELQIEIQDHMGFWTYRILPYQYFCGTGSRFYGLHPGEILITAIPSSCQQGYRKARIRMDDYLSEEFEY